MMNLVKKSTTSMCAKKKRGFTLVELIVVLVILAILCAILVPALLGYIDKARQKQVVLDAKSMYTSSQSLMSDKYSTYNKAMSEGDCTDIMTTADIEGSASAAQGKCTYFSIYVKADTKGGDDQHGYYKIASAIYQENGRTVYLTGGSWQSTTSTVADDAIAEAQSAVTDTDTDLTELVIVTGGSPNDACAAIPGPTKAAGGSGNG